MFTNSSSITRYKVQGKVKPPVLDNVASGLTKNIISEIDGQISNMSVGWTSFEKPFQPDFSGSSFVYGTYFVFSMRIDKKTSLPKYLKKNTPSKPPNVWLKADAIIYRIAKKK